MHHPDFRNEDIALLVHRQIPYEIESPPDFDGDDVPDVDEIIGIVAVLLGIFKIPLEKLLTEKEFSRCLHGTLLGGIRGFGEFELHRSCGQNPPKKKCQQKSK